MKPTIKDIAKRANVSVATVSRTINNSGYVHDETRKQVEKVIEEMGYAPNQLARLLLKRQSGIIGVIIPNTASPFMGELVNAIEEEAMTNDYKVMLCVNNDNFERELDYIKIFEQYMIDGLIMCSNFLNLDKIRDLNIPIITIDHILDPQIPSITTDNIKGGKMVAEELANCGCKNVLILRGPSFLITTAERMLGFEMVAKEKGMRFDFHDFDLVDPDTNFIYNLFLNNPQYDGVFAMADVLGVVAAGAIARCGRTLGKDIALCSFDGLNISNWIYPQLTTVVQPIDYMGAEAVTSLIKLIKGEVLPETHKVLSLELARRQSTSSTITK